MILKVDKIHKCLTSIYFFRTPEQKSIACAVCKKTIFTEPTKSVQCNCNFHFLCIEDKLFGKSGFFCPSCSTYITESVEVELPSFPNLDSKFLRSVTQKNSAVLLDKYQS